MATPVFTREEATPQRPLASYLHTLLVIAILLTLSHSGARYAEFLRSSEHPERLLLYGRIFVSQWIVLAIVIWGVRLRGNSLETILGAKWGSLLQFVRDIAIAAVFWAVAIVLVSTLRSFLQPHLPSPSVLFLLPQTALEKIVWVLISITAGICEEATFRGYLQRQFTAAARNVVVGIVLSAAIFGLAHVYQGPLGAIANGVQGALLGTLAAWRRSLRPGMFAHAWNDIFGGVIAAMLRVRVS